MKVSVRKALNLPKNEGIGIPCECGGKASVYTKFFASPASDSELAEAKSYKCNRCSNFVPKTQAKTANEFLEVIEGFSEEQADIKRIISYLGNIFDDVEVKKVKTLESFAALRVSLALSGELSEEDGRLFEEAQKIVRVHSLMWV